MWTALPTPSGGTALCVKNPQECTCAWGRVSCVWVCLCVFLLFAWFHSHWADEEMRPATFHRLHETLTGAAAAPGPKPEPEPGRRSSAVAHGSHLRPAGPRLHPDRPSGTSKEAGRSGWRPACQG